MFGWIYGERGHSGLEDKNDVRDESKREREGFNGLRNPLGRQLKVGKLKKMGSVVLGLDGFDTLRLRFSGFGRRRETTPSSLNMVKHI